MSLPVGTVIRLLSKQGMVGTLGKLYESVENLSDTYLQPNLNKDSILKPKHTLGNAYVLHEAGKDFVDFLFTLLSLPAGIIIKASLQQYWDGWKHR